MEGDATQLGGTRKTQHQLTRKRRHNSESAQPSEPIRKSPRLRGKVQSRPSPRLWERHNLNQRLTGKPAKSSPRTAEACHRSKQERPRPGPIAQVAHVIQQLSSRKRQRTEIGEEQPVVAAPSPLPPWKRVKRPFQSQQEAVTAFWDSLSKVWLTKRALEEFDRRTAQPASSAGPAGPIRPVPLRQRDLRRKACSDQIKHFARHGGPDLRDLRGYPEPTGANSSAHTMNSSRSATGTTNSKSTPKTGTRKSSAYNRDFEQHLIDHSVYPNMYDYPDNRVTPKPNNWTEINSRLAQPRPSLSPSRFSEGAYDTFQRTNARALSECKVMRTAFPIIAGSANIPNEGELVFTNLEPLTDGTLVDAKPDYYDGARPEQIDKRVRDELASVIIPSTLQHAPCLPNLFAEGKGPDGSAAVAKRQACYDGALGARGTHMLQSYGRDGATYDNNAYTISATYHHDGLLKMYTTHPTQPETPGGEPEYHMTQLRGWCMTDSAQTFRQGASAFRNARDWAKEQRDKLIAAANGRVVDMPIETSTLESSSNGMLSLSAIEPTLHESDTSVDELALDISASVPFPPKRLKGGPEKCHSKPDRKRRPKASSSKAGRRSRRRGRSTQIE